MTLFRFFLRFDQKKEANSIQKANCIFLYALLDNGIEMSLCQGNLLKNNNDLLARAALSASKESRKRENLLRALEKYLTAASHRKSSRMKIRVLQA